MKDGNKIFTKAYFNSVRILCKSTIELPVQKLLYRELCQILYQYQSFKGAIRLKVFEYLKIINQSVLIK